MKTIFRTSLFSGICILLLLVGCGEEDFDFPASQPLVNGSTALSTLPGGTLTVNARITDPVGLQTVDLTYQAWDLAQSEALSNGETAYDYSSAVAVPANAVAGSTHSLILSTTNVNGVMTEFPITVTLDQDVTAPTLADNTPVGVTFLGDGDDVTLEIAVEDDMELATFTITGTNFSEKIDIGSNKYTYTQSLNIQKEGVYDFTIEVTDVAGNTSSTLVSIPAFEPFESMFLADVDSDAELVSDVMGVPLLANGFAQADSVGKVFQVNYYNSVENTAVRFVSSKETFGALTLGADGEGNLLAASSAAVSPLVLGEVGYYQIAIDTRNLTYTVESYIPDDPTFDLIIFMGTGVTVDGSSTCESNADGSEACWWFGSGKELTVDPSNPYRFSGTVELFDFDPVGDGNNGFILGANLSGWSPFWRFDDGTDPNLAVPNGGASFVFDETKYGTYQAVFDTHLNLLTMIKN
ncbi:MAG: hypothetical protein AAF519_17005 [Bacteroidota bacterium]